MLRFAWKTFSRWQMLTEGTDEEKKKKHEQFKYMEQFRETFSRPISNIRFVGLFGKSRWRLVWSDVSLLTCEIRSQTASTPYRNSNPSG